MVLFQVSKGRRNLMNKKISLKKLLVSLLIITSLTFLIACDMPNHNKLYSDENALIQTDNLSSIEDSVTTVNEDFYASSRKSSSGIETIWYYEIFEDMSLDAKCELSVKEGSSKLILIAGDNSITTLLEYDAKEGSDNLTKLQLPLKSGKNYIKLVSKDKANIDVKVAISKGNFN